ncbi:MAG: endonuclease MutS2 [Balneolales bacterium]|nr:endonuclease MutS2 [Balneolales bacterium]
MIIYPLNTTEKSGFEYIREATIAFAMSEVAQERLSEMSPSSDVDVVLVKLGRTRELISLIGAGEFPPLGEMPDIRRALGRARPEGSVLEPASVLEIGVLIQTARRVRQFFIQRDERCPFWNAFVQGVIVLKPLEDEIFRVLTDSGVVKDSASPELQTIRRSLNSRRNDLRSALQKVMRQAAKDGYLSEQEPTIRGGRMVLAVKAEHKRKISGFIHDTSATGQTVYLEPVDALHINNDIRQLENDELREIERIMRILTAQIRENREFISQNAVLMGELDAAMAVARLSMELDGVIPEIAEKKQGRMMIHLIKAYNPHLLLKSKRLKNSETIVPLDLDMDDDEKCLVITGPNAGGKSVALKTLGLHALMFQCGYAIPLSEGSRLPVFGSIYVDMGDEQSIDNDLSTFSSRLEWMRETLNNADSDSLVLIDEAGTGTDPEEGVALYQSLLEDLITRNSRTIVTTHHGNLKVFAHNNPYAVNASMEFDQKTLSPTYRFRKGLPGSSYAFEIAQRMGVNNQILKRSRELLGDTRNRLEHLIAELERMGQEAATTKFELEKQLRDAQKLMNEYEQKYESINKQRDQIREKALIEAKSIMQSANARVEEAVRQIAEGKAGKKDIKQIRKDLDEQKSAVDEDLAQVQEVKMPKTLGTPPKVGDTVKMTDGSSTGELVELSGKQAIVMVNGLRLKTSYKNLVKVQASKKKEQRINVTVLASSDDDGVVRKASPSLDVRGKRGEEAIAELTHYLDRAMVSGLSQVEVIHGKGDGILRKLVHNYLHDRKEVREFALAPWEQGGPGCTLVFFK